MMGGWKESGGKETQAKERLQGPGKEGKRAYRVHCQDTHRQRSGWASQERPPVGTRETYINS